MNPVNLRLLLSIVLLNSPCYGGDYPAEVRKWKIIKHPDQSSSSEFYKFLHGPKYSEHHWTVDKIEGKIVAHLQKDLQKKEQPSPKFDTSIKFPNYGTPLDPAEKKQDFSQLRLIRASR